MPVLFQVLGFGRRGKHASFSLQQEGLSIISSFQKWFDKGIRVLKER